MRTSVDLNADVGEGCGDDAALIEIVSSVNIACGGHAGDERSMVAALEHARQYGASAGAHPSYPDREGFGRRPIDISDCALGDAVAGQIRDLARLGGETGVSLTHVKPHGALYHAAAETESIAEILVQCTASIAPGAWIVGPPDSALQTAARSKGLRFLAEGFADRAYGGDGRLVARDRPGAVLACSIDRTEQAVALALSDQVVTIDGQTRALAVDTICLHGDTPGAVQSSRDIRSALIAAGLEIRSPF
ncbi:MAG: 5-oxoprolinase subunit PxpA [Pseudomonadota bacterium]